MHSTPATADCARKPISSEDPLFEFISFFLPSNSWVKSKMNDQERKKLASLPALSTVDVPQEYWSSAFLIGRIPLRALQSEPRVSYSLYIPPEHYSNAKKLPLLVFVHGTSRNHSIQDFAAFASSTPCAVLAPLFPAGLDAPNDLNSYQILRSMTLRSDLALLSMLDEIGRTWPGIETNKVFLMGFSGGAQFAHRFMYLYPERLYAVSVGAPGSVTRLNEIQSWPKGVKNVQDVFGRVIDKDLLRKLKVFLVVGGSDVSQQGGYNLLLWLLQRKASGSTEAEEPPNRDEIRTDIVSNLLEEWRQIGLDVQMKVVDGIAHKSDGLRETVLAWIGPLMKAYF
jgi:pimeloyl-ACP methyl ester carboxylesterase